MSLKANLRWALVGAMSVLAFSATSALACKGTTTLLRDDFSEEDPAWDLEASVNKGAVVADGALKLTADSGHFLDPYYQGQYFPAGDACVDITSPAAFTKNVTSAGIGLWVGANWDFIYISSNGTAGVLSWVPRSGLWNNPVPPRKADSIKGGASAVNTLRVVWKGPPGDNSSEAPDPSVQIFINDKPFVKFKAAPNPDRLIALFGDTDGTTYEFRNLDVTQ